MSTISGTQDYDLQSIQMTQTGNFHRDLHALKRYRYNVYAKYSYQLFSTRAITIV